MLGRGALCRPDLPRLVKAAVGEAELSPLRWNDVLLLVLEFYQLTLEHYDACHVGNPIKQWLVYLRAYYPQAALLFDKIKRLREPDAIGDGLRSELLVQGRRLDAA